MVVSGALAGLVGMPQLLRTPTPTTGVPARHRLHRHRRSRCSAATTWSASPSAALFAFLDRTATQLDLEGCPNEIVSVMQGVIVLSVVVAYELVRRYGLERQQQKVGEELQRRPSRSRSRRWPREHHAPKHRARGPENPPRRGPR